MRATIILAGLFLGIVFNAFSQVDTVRAVSDPPNPESVYNEEIPHDVIPQKDSVMVSWSDLPKKLVRALNHDARFTGWQESGVFLNKNTRLYMLYITTDSLTTKYGLDERGKTVTYTSFIRKNQ